MSLHHEHLVDVIRLPFVEESLLLERRVVAEHHVGLRVNQLFGQL